VAGGRWYEVVVNDVRLLPSNRFAILGEIRDRGEPINPWGVLVRVRNGLIIESPSHLSEKALLERTSGCSEDHRPHADVP